MFLGTSPASQPVSSLTASGHDGSGGSSLLLIALLVVAVVWLGPLLLRSRPTVVVVQNEAGSIWGFALIAVAVGILCVAFVPGATPF